MTLRRSISHLVFILRLNTMTGRNNAAIVPHRIEGTPLFILRSHNFTFVLINSSLLYRWFNKLLWHIMYYTVYESHTYNNFLWRAIFYREDTQVKFTSHIFVLKKLHITLGLLPTNLRGNFEPYDFMSQKYQWYVNTPLSKAQRIHL